MGSGREKWRSSAASVQVAFGLLLVFSAAPAALVFAFAGWTLLVPAATVPGYVFVRRWFHGRRGSYRLNLAFGAVLALATLIALIAHGSGYLAIPVTGLYALLAVAQCYSRRVRAFPIFLVYAAMFVAYAVVGVVFAPQPALSLIVGEPERLAGAYLLLSFLAVTFVSVVAVQTLVPKIVHDQPSSPTPGTPVNAVVALVVAVLGLLGYIALSKSSAAGELGSLTTGPRMIEWVAAIFLVRIGSESGRRRYLVAALLLAAVDLVVGFGESALYQGAGTAVAIFAASIGRQKQVPALLLALVALAALQLNVVKLEYRTQAGGIVAIGELGSADGIVAFLHTAEDAGIAPAAEQLSYSATRFSYTVDLLGFAQATLPTATGFPGGASFRAAPLMLVPRVLWPGKPRSALGNVYGHELGLLDEADFTTSQNTSAPVEGYITQGLFGMLLTAIASGVLMGLFGRIRGRHRDDWIIYGAVESVVFIGGVESDSSTYLVFIFIAPIVVAIGIWLIRLLSATATSSAGGSAAERQIHLPMVSTSPGSGGNLGSS